MEWFTADFLRLFTKKCQNLALKKTDHFDSFDGLLNKRKLTEKFSDNLEQNMSRVFHFLAKFVFNLKSKQAFSNTKISRKCKIKDSGPSQKQKSVSSDNLGQKVGDKLTKLSKIGFSMEWFTADFLQFFTKKCQNLALKKTDPF